ncbi:probable amino acid permease 7 isoform X1 [Hordeum vulgare subsp. vulgare]|uniref:Amino acid transporter transmembrane domain-containing protein n=2 Tax=Hordeum vulgare TaxID=4513 RepID=A0A8I6XWM8_HORVV|nr:probable amino acid permease 7 isoform X1 [Hordeum vulgare subsp. vulgare]
MGGGRTGRGRGDRQAEPLLDKLSGSSYDLSEEHPVKRTGTVWTAMAHVITAVIGSGVLSLAWSVAQLGWVGGPAAMVLFAGVTVVQSSLLADCYISRDPERGAAVRNRSYVDAVKLYLGEKSQVLSGVFLGFSLFGNSVVYTLTSAASMRAIERANCYHREGHGAPCCAAAGGGGSSDAYYMLMFGLAQAALSQIPDFHSMAWLSVFAAAMSFSYSFIGFGLGAAKVIDNGVIKGAIGGVSLVSPTQKVWRVAQALGDIAFAYPFSLVLLEIEDTLGSPPAESETMKAASRASIAVTTFFYLGCGCFGYAAFGDGTPGNLLAGFGEPYWLVGLANLCVVLHLLGGYQVYAQPMFALVERRFGAGVAEIPLLGRVTVARLCFRTANVAAATAVAVWFPYFNQVVGLIGAFTFWPLAIHFPVQMYLAQGKVAPWTRRWIAIQAFSAACLIACGFASVGSAMGVFSPERS